MIVAAVWLSALTIERRRAFWRAERTAPSVNEKPANEKSAAVWHEDRSNQYKEPERKVRHEQDFSVGQFLREEGKQKDDAEDGGIVYEENGGRRGED